SPLSPPAPTLFPYTTLFRSGGTNLRHTKGKVGSPTPIKIVIAFYDLKFTALTIGSNGHIHLGRVTLDAKLKLLVTVIGQTHRQAVAVKSSGHDIKRKDRVVLGTVTYCCSSQEIDVLHGALLVVLDHKGRYSGNLVRRLRCDQ